MFKYLFVFLLLTFIPGARDVFAQKEEDVIYLSNGSVIHGIILADSTEKRIRIMSHNGDIWSFTRSDIDSLKHEKPIDFKAVAFTQTGSAFSFMGALLIRSGNNVIGKPLIPSVSLGYNYLFRPYFSAGT